MKKFYTHLLVQAAIISLLATGCGNSSDSSSYVSNGAGYDMAGAARADSFASKSADLDSVPMMEESADYDVSAASDDGGSTEPIEVDGRSATESSPKKLDREKIIYTGNVTLETMDWDKSKASVKKLIEDNDGIIQSENEYYNDSDWYYNTSETVRTLYITARIPSDKFNQVLEGTDGIGHITVKSMDASNVTREYYDVQARLKTKQAELKRFEEILSKADKVKDILEIESHISNVQYEIDSAKSQLENLNLDVSYSTINITLTEVTKYSKDPDETRSRLKETLEGAGHFFMSFLWGLFRFILYAGPIILIIGAILFGLIKLIKKFYKPVKKPHVPKFGRKREPLYVWPSPGTPPWYPGAPYPPYGVPAAPQTDTKDQDDTSVSKDISISKEGEADASPSKDDHETA